MADHNLFIERNDEGAYVVKRRHAERASAIETTQARAIERAAAIDPKAAIHVERVRDTVRGGSDKWRHI
jgi:hypothetical protein